MLVTWLAVAKNQNPIQDGHQSGYILQFLGILNKSFILNINIIALVRANLVLLLIQFFFVFFIKKILLNSYPVFTMTTKFIKHIYKFTNI